MTADASRCPPLALAALSYVFVEVEDLATATTFYRDTLGLPVEFAQQGVCTFLRPAGGGARIALYATDADVSAAPRNTLVAFDVPDVAAAARTLRERGVPVSDVVDVPGGRAVLFDDPEGNRLELHEPHEPHAG